MTAQSQLLPNSRPAVARPTQKYIARARRASSLIAEDDSELQSECASASPFGLLAWLAIVIAVLPISALIPLFVVYGLLEGVAVALFNYPLVGLSLWRWPVLPAVNGPAVVLDGVWRLLLRRPFPYASRQELLPEAQSRIEKACRLWKGLTADQSSDPRPGFVGQALRIIAMPVETALRLRADLSPRGHYKGVHRQGVCVRASLEWEPWVGEQYSGIFSSGSDEALVRLSWAVAPEPGARVAGAAVKCFRDGVASANFVALHNILEAQASANLLELPLCTHIPVPSSGASVGRSGTKDWRQAGLVDVRAGITGSRFIWALRNALLDKPPIPGCPAGAAGALFGVTGLSDLASHAQDGSPAGEAAFPFALVLQPNPLLAARVARHLADGAESLDALRAALRGAAAESAARVLYRVFLVPGLDPSALRFAGEVRLRGEACRSLLGDRRLLFRHTMLTDDARVGGAGGTAAQRWLYQLVHNSDKRYEYEGLPGLYSALLPAWPRPAPPGAPAPPPADAAFGGAPPELCPLRAAWESGDATPRLWRRALAVLGGALLAAPALVAGLLLLPPLLLLLGLVLARGGHAAHRARETLTTLRRLVSGSAAPPPPHRASLLSFPFDNAAAQLAVARSMPSRRYAAVSPTGVWGVWGHEGLAVFYDGAYCERDPTKWPLTPLGLVQTVWGTAKDPPPPASTRGGCCPAGGRGAALAAVEYGLPPLDGAEHRARKQVFHAAMRPGLVLDAVRTVVRRELRGVAERVRGGEPVALADEAFTLVAHLTCEAFFGLPVCRGEAVQLGRALDANFSTFDDIARSLRFGAAGGAARLGHERIFGFMARALSHARAAGADAVEQGEPTSLLASYLRELGPTRLPDTALLADLYHVFNGGYAFARCLPQLAYALHAMPRAREALRREAAIAEQQEHGGAPGAAARALAHETLRYFNGVQLVFGAATVDIPESAFASEGARAAAADGGGGGDRVAIPRGDFLAAFLYATCRGSRHERPDVFWPGRWEEAAHLTHTVHPRAPGLAH